MTRTSAPVRADATPLAALIAKRLTEAMALHPSVRNQVHLGKASGLAQSSVSKILRGEADPAVGTLYALANGLGLPLSVLLSDLPVEASKMPRPAAETDLSQLAPLQRAFVDVVIRAAKAGRLPDAECARLIGDWAGRLETRESAGPSGSA